MAWLLRQRIHRNKLLIPSNNQITLVVQFESFAPLQHLFEGLLVQQVYVNVSTFHVNLGCQFWIVFAFVLEVEDKHSVDPPSYQQVFRVVELGMIYESNHRHVLLTNYVVQLIHKDELEIVRNHQI